MTISSQPTGFPSDAPQVLLDAQDALRRGDVSLAYQLSLEATRIAPDNIKTWLMRAQTAPSIIEAVDCLNRVNTMQPIDPEVRQNTYAIVQKLLKKDPFLLYLEETGDWYQVRSGTEISLTIPKGRSIPEPYPIERPGKLHTTYRWLWMGLVGLPLAGLGAMAFAPLAAASAIGIHLKDSSGENRIRSLVLIILSGSLWLCGLLLGVILLVHLV